MFDKKQNLMPALLSAAILALAATATAQEHSAIQDLDEATDDATTFVPGDLFSATDDHSTFVVDACIEKNGAESPVVSTSTTSSGELFDFSSYENAGPGELVIVGGFTASDSPKVLHFVDMDGIIDSGAACCACGTQGGNPMGCTADSSPCCCKAEISTSLDEIHCYCQGGKDCSNMIGSSSFRGSSDMAFFAA